MGVKTKLSIKQINHFIDVSKLKETKNGVSDTVYILDNKYILKLFENSTEANIKEEIKLLKLLKKLKVSTLEKKPVNINGKPALFYKRSKGDIVKNIKKEHITQIGSFLKDLHDTTKNKRSKNKMLFRDKELKRLIKKTRSKKIKKIYNTINISSKDDGIIHGDIFKDNVLFKDDKLSSVIDFSEACNGDFHFDLAVVALDWCKNNKQLKWLLESYNTNIKRKKFKEYIKYAGIYYITTRYLDNRDYKEILKKIKRLC